jgi:hypothetical protein
MIARLKIILMIGLIIVTAGCSTSKKFKDFDLFDSWSEFSRISKQHQKIPRDQTDKEFSHFFIRYLLRETSDNPLTLEIPAFDISIRRYQDSLQIAATFANTTNNTLCIFIPHKSLQGFSHGEYGVIAEAYALEHGVSYTDFRLKHGKEVLVDDNYLSNDEAAYTQDKLLIPPHEKITRTISLNLKHINTIDTRYTIRLTKNEYTFSIMYYMLIRRGNTMRSMGDPDAKHAFYGLVRSNYVPLHVRR